MNLGDDYVIHCSSLFCDGQILLASRVLLRNSWPEYVVYYSENGHNRAVNSIEELADICIMSSHNLTQEVVRYPKCFAEVILNITLDRKQFTGNVFESGLGDDEFVVRHGLVPGSQNAVVCGSTLRFLADGFVVDQSSVTYFERQLWEYIVDLEQLTICCRMIQTQGTLQKAVVQREKNAKLRDKQERYEAARVPALWETDDGTFNYLYHADFDEYWIVVFQASDLSCIHVFVDGKGAFIELRDLRALKQVINANNISLYKANDSEVFYLATIICELDKLGIPLQGDELSQICDIYNLTCSSLDFVRRNGILNFVTKDVCNGQTRYQVVHINTVTLDVTSEALHKR